MHLPAEAVVTGRHPVVDVVGEEVEPVLVLPVGQQLGLVVEELLDLVLEFDVDSRHGRLVARHPFDVEAHRATGPCLEGRRASRSFRAASMSDQLSQVIMSAQRWYIPRAPISQYTALVLPG